MILAHDYLGYTSSYPSCGRHDKYGTYISEPHSKCTNVQSSECSTCTTFASEDSEAINVLGLKYKIGKGIKKGYSPKESDMRDYCGVEMFNRAISLGNSNAMANLGYMYHFNEGIPLGYDKAIKLYLAAISLGNKTAMANLGLMYSKGQGVEQNYEKAFELYTRATELGSSVAMSNLGEMYLSGKGVGQDFSKARELFERAASLNSWGHV
jgi:uncharacterized protein